MRFYGRHNLSSNTDVNNEVLLTMSNKKVRVEALMPKDKPLWYLRSISLTILAIGFGLAYGIHAYNMRMAPKEALPMKGKCVDVSMTRYVGDGDKDGKSCIWRNQLYWCMYDSNKELWGCNSVENTSPPAEVAK